MRSKSVSTLPASLYVGTMTTTEGVSLAITLRAYDARVYDVNVSDQRPLSALPSPLARLVAFLAILCGGVAGGIIGFALVDIQSDDASDTLLGLGILSGSVISAGGTAIIAVLVLRAIGEWKDLGDR